MSSALDKGKDVYNIIKPFLLPAVSALSPFAGGLMGAAGSMLKVSDPVPIYDPKNNVFWLKDIQKKLVYISPSDH